MFAVGFGGFGVAEGQASGVRATCHVPRLVSGLFAVGFCGFGVAEGRTLRVRGACHVPRATLGEWVVCSGFLWVWSG